MYLTTFTASDLNAVEGSQSHCGAALMKHNLFINNMPVHAC